jgi:hypothetical protein
MSLVDFGRKPAGVSLKTQKPQRLRSAVHPRCQVKLDSPQVNLAKPKIKVAGWARHKKTKAVQL